MGNLSDVFWTLLAMNVLELKRLPSSAVLIFSKDSSLVNGILCVCHTAYIMLEFWKQGHVSAYRTNAHGPPASDPSSVSCQSYIYSFFCCCCHYPVYCVWMQPNEWFFFHNFVPFFFFTVFCSCCQISTKYFIADHKYYLLTMHYQYQYWWNQY